MTKCFIFIQDTVHRTIYTCTHSYKVSTPRMMVIIKKRKTYFLIYLTINIVGQDKRALLFTGKIKLIKGKNN